MMKNKRTDKTVSCFISVFLLLVIFKFYEVCFAQKFIVPVGNRYAVVYYGYISSDLASVFIERNYSLIIASSETPIPNTLKKSGIRIYAYLDILGLPIEQLSWVEKNYPKWILYKADGKLATYWYNANFICNIAERSFQDYLISRAKNILSKGFDGLFLDDVVPNVNSFDVAYNESAYGNWSNALLVFFERLKNETGASIIYNAGWAPPMTKLMKIADGVMLESHPGSWNGSVNSPVYYYRTWNEIYSISLEAQKFAEEGKIIIALSYGDSLDAEEYTYAVTRLFDFYYWYSTPDLSKIPNAKVLNINLGAPLGAYNQKNGIYYRIYENGLVVVSSSYGNVELDVPKSWKELFTSDGQSIKVEDGKVTLNVKPNTGVVLLLNENKATNFLFELTPFILLFMFVLVVSIIVLTRVALNRKNS